MMLVACLALMGGCKETVHVQCCHRLTTNAAFTAKAVAWPMVQTSGNGCCRSLDTMKRVQKPLINKTEHL